MQTRQSYQIRSTWEAEDYAKSAHQSATAAQNYYQLTSQKASVMQSEIDSLKLQVQTFKRELDRVEKNSNESRNTALIWGCLGALVTGAIVNLILVPQPAQIQPTRSDRFHLGG